MHALSGGAGSGFGSLLARHMVEDYPDRILKSYALMPSSYDGAIIKAYNAVLTVPYLIDCIHEVFCISNEAIGRICSDKLKIHPYFYNMNYLISLCMSGVTACLRFEITAHLKILPFN